MVKLLYENWFLGLQTKPKSNCQIRKEIKDEGLLCKRQNCYCNGNMILVSSKLFAKKGIAELSQNVQVFEKTDYQLFDQLPATDLMGTNSRITITHSPANK